MFPEYFVYVGIAINFVGTLSYIRGTLKGEIQPNRVSFTLWSIAPIITYFAALDKGVGIQALLPLSVGIFPFLILLASFFNKKAYWKIGKFDLVCGGLSLLGLFLWYITLDSNVAIFFSIAADGIAFGPTIVKAWKFPDTEGTWMWLLTGFSGLITLLTIDDFQFANAAFPIYFLVANIFVFILVKFKLGLRHKQ